MDDHTSQTIQTYDAFAEDYAQINGSVGPICALLETFLRHLDGERVLDVGCGPGRDAAYFAARSLHVTGVDLSARFLALARRQVPGARLARMDMRRLAFSDGVFDGLWACASLLHLPKRDVPAALAGFRRVVRPGGLVYVGVKAGEGEELIATPRYGGRARFFAYYTPAELEALVQGAGLALLETVVQPQGETTWLNIFAQVA